MTALDMPQDYIQMQITDFVQDVKLPVQIKEELNDKLKLAVQWHLEKFVKLYLKLIKDVEKRREVIELIEENYRQEAELELEMEETNVEEAVSRRDQAKEDFDLIVDTLRDIKSAWKIP